MKSFITTKLDGGKLEISVPALTQMLTFIQNTSRKKEAGGVLLGRYILENSDIVIDDITVPMRGDRRGRFDFFRHFFRHQEVIDQTWLSTKGTTTYLGEWHTHPESIPTPSNTDLKNWKRQLQENILSGDELYFIILGIDALRIWEFSQRSLSHELIGELKCPKQ